jgi:predicted ATPase/DNA-binding SARP family transcriptional activator
VEVRVLGPLEVIDGERTVNFRGTRQRRLLTILVLHLGQPMSAERLIDLLWGDSPPGNPTNALQAQISQLRKALGADKLVTQGSTYTLDLDPRCLDSHRFELLVRQARELLGRGHAVEASEALVEALALWRGDAFADAEHDDAIRPTATRLTELHLSALELRIDADLELGRQAELVPELEALTALHPLRERLWAQLMVALYRCGRQADALRAYGTARHVLVEELGVEPGDELREIEAMVLAHDARLDATSPPQARSARPARHRLPASLNRFVGRATDRDNLADLVATERLVTVVGPGGIGKTRLALEAAEHEESAGGEVRVVELARISGGPGLLPAVASAVGLDESDPASAAARSGLPPRQQLIDHLREASLLLVIDNCEHVVAPVADLVGSLLVECHDLRVLATSREPLGVPGERVRTLSPLPVDEAVELFLDRAHTSGGEVASDEIAQSLVADICERLDGLPLAIELAAARTRGLSVPDVAERLDDRFRLLTSGPRTADTRQQTLRAVVDWSYDLLDPTERVVFRRLAVFVGGFELRAAEAVCADETVPANEVADVMLRLVDKSLVVADAVRSGQRRRYRMLETLRHYGLERLAESGEAIEVRRRHAAWMTTFTVDAAEGLRGSNAFAWRQQLEAEIGNSRSALDWWAANGHAEPAMEIAVGYAWVWFLRGEWAEGQRWIDDAISVGTSTSGAVDALARCWLAYLSVVRFGLGDRAQVAEDSVTQLRRLGDRRRLVDALLLLGSIVARTGDTTRTATVLAEAVTESNAQGDPWARAVAELLGTIDALRVGDLERAERSAFDAAQRFRTIGDDWGLVEALGTAATVAQARGDYRTAESVVRERLELAQALALPAYEAMAMIELANLQTLRDDPVAAESLVEEALALTPSTWARALGLNARGLAARRQGDPARATRYHTEALAAYEAADAVQGAALSLGWMAWCAIDQVDTGPHVAEECSLLAERGLVAAETSQDPRAVAFALEALAGAREASGDPREAARLLGRAHALRQTVHAPLPTAERLDVDGVETRARARLGDDLFEAAFQGGLRERSSEQAPGSEAASAGPQR